MQTPSDEAKEFTFSDSDAEEKEEQKKKKKKKTKLISDVSIDRTVAPIEPEEEVAGDKEDIVISESQTSHPDHFGISLYTANVLRVGKWRISVRRFPSAEFFRLEIDVGKQSKKITRTK